jgi:RNA ligase (TIGR02306 family)
MENTNSVCYIARINEIKSIPNADNIKQAVVGGWNCIVQKDQYAEGGLVAVATTDAVIPQELSDVMNVTNYLRKGQRVRTVKLRGAYSECLIIPLKYLTLPYTKTKVAAFKEGDDLMELLSITKYEPPVKQVQLASGRKIRWQDNPNFHVYYKFPNIKNVPGIFTEEDEIEITRKLHGTNARFGIVKKTKLSLWDKIKMFFNFADEFIEYEFVVGSHNVEKGSDSQGFYDTNVWYEIDAKYKIKERLWDMLRYTPDEIGSGIVLYGEIYGAGIQKNYDYNLKTIDFAAFDISINGIYQGATMAQTLIIDLLELPYVPILFQGNWSQEMQDKFTFNNSIEGTKIPHEGIVIKHLSGERNKIAKVINPDYLIYGEKHDVGDSH